MALDLVQICKVVQTYGHMGMIGTEGLFPDRFGHDAGDLVLVTLAGLLKKNIRKEDIPCRYGGEELLIIQPEMSVEITCLRAEKLREIVRQLEVKHPGVSLGVITASFGVASFPLRSC